MVALLAQVLSRFGDSSLSVVNPLFDSFDCACGKGRRSWESSGDRPTALLRGRSKIVAKRWPGGRNFERCEARRGHVTKPHMRRIHVVMHDETGDKTAIVYDHLVTALEKVFQRSALHRRILFARLSGQVDHRPITDVDAMMPIAEYMKPASKYGYVVARRHLCPLWITFTGNWCSGGGFSLLAHANRLSCSPARGGRVKRSVRSLAFFWLRPKRFAASSKRRPSSHA